jgi:putative redox protein
MPHVTQTPGVPALSLVTVQGDASGFAQRIAVGPHELISDEPVEVGGTAMGPGPYDLLLAALGWCTSMTISLYARRKNWPLKNVVVELSHSKLHASDCENCVTKEHFLDRIDRKIHLEGNLTAEQRLRLLEIASRCPVHRTLKSEVIIRTEAF